MRRLGFAGVGLAAALLSGNAGLACGDKLVLIRGGVRFQRAYAQHQANLLIYSHGTESGAIIAGAKLQTTLKQAGHKLQMVESASQLEEALKSGNVDVVLADFADAPGIARQLQSAASKPVVLPVLYKPSKADLAAAQREYRFALKASADDIQYLTAIDEAMKARLRIGAKS